MQRQQRQETQFFSIEAFKSLDFQVNQDLLGELKESGYGSKSYDTTATHLGQNKTHLKQEFIPDAKIDDSCFEDFQDFIKKMPKETEPQPNTSLYTQFSIHRQRKQEFTPSYLIEKEKYVAQSNWLNDLELQCFIEYNNKRVKTVCRIKDAEMQFQNGGCSFRLTKISKMKVLYQNFQKCICFTYEQTKGKKVVEIKFKIFVQNDLKEDLYVLFSKIAVQKLLLLDYLVPLSQKEDQNADKFMITGQIYKLSQVMHHWKLRKLVITDRIESFKGNKCTFQMKNIKEMWTRFQVHQHCLVIKLRHGKDKTQLALPMVNYTAKYCKNNWLYRIYRLLTSTP